MRVPLRVLFLSIVAVSLTAARMPASGPSSGGSAFGAFSAGGPSLDEVAISRRTAARLGLRAGEIIQVSGDPSMERSRFFRVAVVWNEAEHPADVTRREPVLRFRLPVLETLLDRSDVVDRIVVRLRDPARAPQVRDDLNALPGGYDAYTAADLVRHTSRTFLVVSRFHRAIGLITLLASGIFLVTLMTLKITEMRREIGALRLMGISPWAIALAVIMIATTVALTGAAAGIGLGAVLVWAINAYYQAFFDTDLRFAMIVPSTILQAAGLAVLLGIGAGVVVAFRLLRRPPLEQVGR